MPGSDGADGHSRSLFQCLRWDAGQKQMEKEEWMSLQILSCNPEASRAGDGKRAVHSSAVSQPGSRLQS